MTGQPAATCLAKVERTVLKRAQRINDTAAITESTVTYTNDVGDTFGEIYLVRTSDETDPSDYVAVTRGFGANCSIKYVSQVNDGILPGDDLSEARGIMKLPEAACLKKANAQILQAAKRVDRSARMSGGVDNALYGTSRSFEHVFTLTLSGAEHTYDFVGVVEETADDPCKVKQVRLMAVDNNG